ncbi:MAG: hypothetical protein FD189_978 [Elusimicrobia bacterium]|nr:MAG: hypothetical protein FD154_1219 [Elusimicrobiota bacterium]KAF0156425.1 MAG: hypothetical protein FD189_978 [Elusimicrobiota bacterium]
MRGNSLLGAAVLLLFAAAAAPAPAQERRLGEAMPVVEELDPGEMETAAKQIELAYEDAVIVEDPMRGTIIVSKYRWKNWVARAVYLLLINIALIILIISLPKNEEQNILISYFLSGAGFTLAIWVLFCALLLVKWGNAAAAMIFPLSLLMFVTSYIVLMRIKKSDISLAEIRESFKKMAGAKSEDQRLSSVYGKPGDWPDEDFIKLP